MSQRVLQPAFRACKCMQVRATLEQTSLRQSASNRMYLCCWRSGFEFDCGNDFCCGVCEKHLHTKRYIMSAVCITLPPCVGGKGAKAAGISVHKLFPQESTKSDALLQQVKILGKCGEEYTEHGCFSIVLHSNFYNRLHCSIHLDS